MTDEYAATNAAAGSSTVVSTDSDPSGTDPSVPFPAYHPNRARWELCDMVFIGTDAVREAGTDALPQYTNESDARYAIRKKLAAFIDTFAKTVLASVGYLLNPEPTFDDDMDPYLVKLWENVDGAGTHGAVQARKLATTGIIRGYAGLFTDYTRPDKAKPRKGFSLAGVMALVTGAQLDGSDEAALELRPYFVIVRADDIINPFYEPIGGQRILTLFVRRECTYERKGFARKPIEKYRVYERNGDVVTASVYVKREGDTKSTLEGAPIVMRNIKEIPWSPFIAGEEIIGGGAVEGEIKPPLYDLARKSVQYHATLTNILSLEKDAMVPTPVRVGAVPYTAQNVPVGSSVGDFPPIRLGPGNTIEVPAMDPMPANPFFWSSPDVSVLGPANQTLDRTAAEMDTAGGVFMAADPNGVESGEAKLIKGASQRATLRSTGRALRDCYELAYQHAGQFTGKKAGRLHFNEDFSGLGTDTDKNKDRAAANYTAGIWTLEEARSVSATGELPEGYEPNDVDDLVAEQLQKEDEEADAEKARLALEDAA